MKNYAVFSCLIVMSFCRGVEKKGAQEGGGSLSRAFGSFRKKRQDRITLRDICFNTPLKQEDEIDGMVKSCISNMSEEEKKLNTFSDITTEEQLKFMIALGFLDNALSQLPQSEYAEAAKRLFIYLKEQHAKIRFGHAQAGFCKREEAKMKEGQKK